MSPVKNCNQCGKCCINYANGGLSASPEDIEHWETHRPDIAEYVVDGQIWIDPRSNEQLNYCPWLVKLPDQRKYDCSIYLDRPSDCKHYPVDIKQMVRDDCEMLETRDLANTKQAQRRLDDLMSDSRPAVGRYRLQR